MSSRSSLNSRHRAFQYYALLKMRAQRNLSTYLTDTVLPFSIPVYSIMTNNSNTVSDLYSLDLKVNMVEHIAGGKGMVKGWAWCSDSDCDLDFPVTKAKDCRCSCYAGFMTTWTMVITSHMFRWLELKSQACNIT
jgi:hypothetical protein